MENCCLSPGLFLIAAITLLISWILQYTGKKCPKHLKEIPGPKGLPLIGNIHQMSKIQTHQFSKWSQEFGDIYKLNLGGQQLVIVSNPKMAKELFNIPASTGRPQFKALSPYENQDPLLGINTSDGELWEVHRRFLIRQLREFGFGKSSMEQLIMEELDELLKTFENKSEGATGTEISGLDSIFRLPVVNSLWRILTSNRFDHDDSKTLSVVTEGVKSFNAAVSGSGLLMFLPSLRKIMPKLSGYLRIRNALDLLLKLFEAPVQTHKETYQEDTLRDFIDVYLSEVKKTTDPTSPFYGDLAERQLVTMLFDVFFAGSDTTINTLSWAILYLCKYPKAQEKLQKEVGSVTDGDSRKVALSDRKSMPYTQALIDEILRHSSVIADGVAHRALEDFEFQGYFFPKNCWIQPNIYYIHHSPKIWESPDTFLPERFLSSGNDDNSQLKYEKSENIFPFSGSKRVCIGETLARNTLFLFLTNIFQQFSVSFVEGQETPSEFESMPGFFRGPLPFSAVMTQRK